MQKINSENLKTETRAIYRRYRTDIFISLLLAAGVGGLLGLLGGDSILVTILTGIFSLILSGSIARNLYRAHQDKDEMYARDTFSVMSNNFIGLMTISAIQFGARLLGTIFFVIPGIIAEYSLSLANFIAADSTNNLEGQEACVESHRLMKGNRMKLFTAELRYTLPVYIFGFITGALLVASMLAMVVVIADMETLFITNSNLSTISGFNPDVGASPWFAILTLLTFVFGFITLVFSMIASIGQYATRVAFYNQLRDYEITHGGMSNGYDYPSHKSKEDLNAEALRRKDKEILQAHNQNSQLHTQTQDAEKSKEMTPNQINCELENKQKLDGKVELGDMKVEPLSQDILEPKIKLNEGVDETHDLTEN